MKKRFVIRLLLVSILFLGLRTVVSNQRVSASSYTMCGVLAPANDASNCLTSGQNYETCTVDNPSTPPTSSISNLSGSNCPTGSSNTLKTRFINNINYLLYLTFLHLMLTLYILYNNYWNQLISGY